MRHAPTTPSNSTASLPSARRRFASRGAGLAIVGLLAISCGKSGGFAGELEFAAERDFIPDFQHDSGWAPANAPAAIRVVATATGTTAVSARATTDGNALNPVAGSGEIAVTGGFELEISARIDAAGVEYEGVVEAFSYEIEPMQATFDPFLLEDEVSVQSPLPAAELGRVPVPSVPGATLIIEITGGEVVTTFEGTCARGEGGVGQYTGESSVTGTVELAGTIEIEIPILGTESFGPFAVSVPLPELSEPLDLGARTLDSGELVDDATVCDGDSASDTDAPDNTSGGTGTGTPTSDATSSSASASSGSQTGDTSAGSGESEGSGEGSTAAETEGSGDPVYPRPDPGCADGYQLAQIIDTDFYVCAPPCDEMDQCPDAATGSATPTCAIFEAATRSCMQNADCTSGQICLAGVCEPETPTYCALQCETGQCPMGMDCVEGGCAYG